MLSSEAELWSKESGGSDGSDVDTEVGPAENLHRKRVALSDQEEED